MRLLRESRTLFVLLLAFCEHVSAVLSSANVFQVTHIEAGAACSAMQMCPRPRREKKQIVQVKKEYFGGNLKFANKSSAAHRDAVYTALGFDSLWTLEPVLSSSCCMLRAVLMVGKYPSHCVAPKKKPVWLRW